MKGQSSFKTKLYVHLIVWKNTKNRNCNSQNSDFISGNCNFISCNYDFKSHSNVTLFPILDFTSQLPVLGFTQRLKLTYFCDIIKEK